MRKPISRIYAAALLALTASAGTDANAIGWPENYEGVMLQGFHWDSYADTKCANPSERSREGN